MAYLFVVSMDVTAEAEALFNEVYDEEHIPYLLEVPGVRKVTRARGEPFKVAIGGELKESPAASPVYTAIYEVDGPEVLASDGWAAAVEKGRWPGEVRPHTTNRSHALFKVTGVQGG
ncbi:MAG: hypothetical protein AAFU61_13300 [Pseudomonadota bacterium]